MKNQSWELEKLICVLWQISCLHIYSHERMEIGVDGEECDYRVPHNLLNSPYAVLLKGGL